MTFSVIVTVPTFVLISFIYLISSIYSIFILTQTFPGVDNVETIDITNYIVVIFQSIIYLLTSLWVNYSVYYYVSDASKHIIVFMSPLILNIYWILVEPYLDKESDYYKYYYMQIAILGLVLFCFILYSFYNLYQYLKPKPVYSPLHQI